MSVQYSQTADVFKAFCDENRVQIVEILAKGELCACVLLEDLHIAQSTLSHHMKILCASGIVNSRREGKSIFYSISRKGCEDACVYISGLTQSVDNGETILKNEICYA